MVDFSFPGLVGRIERLDPFTSNLVQPRIVDIWLPPDYDQKPEQRYSVLYMHDGENLFDSSTSKFSHMDWGMDETVARLMAEQKIRPTIVVGLWATEKRVLEYMPQKLAEGKSRDRVVESLQLEAGGLPESDQYLRFIVNEVKPYLDKNYRTLTDRANTIVMGSSMGGLISLYAVCEYPEVFGGAGCVSTHFPIGRGIVLGYMKANLPRPGNHKFYFDYGTKTADREYERYQLKADEILEAHGFTRGLDWVTMRYEGHKHSEIDWRKRVNIPLEFLLGV